MRYTRVKEQDMSPRGLNTSRVFHRYGNTCGNQVMGTMGMGMVWYLAHRDILCTHTMVSWVCHGYIATW